MPDEMKRETALQIIEKLDDGSMMTVLGRRQDPTLTSVAVREAGASADCFVPRVQTTCTVLQLLMGLLHLLHQ